MPRGGAVSVTVSGSVQMEFDLQACLAYADEGISFITAGMVYDADISSVTIRRCRDTEEA
jgi:hypothetical protein